MSDRLQKWEGRVESVEKDTFWARIKNLVTFCEYQVEIDLSVLQSKEKKWLCPGALFIWYVKKDRSIIRFRRLHKWTEEEIKETEQSAKKIFEMISKW